MLNSCMFLIYAHGLSGKVKVFLKICILCQLCSCMDTSLDGSTEQQVSKDLFDSYQ